MDCRVEALVRAVPGVPGGPGHRWTDLLRAVRDDEPEAARPRLHDPWRPASRVTVTQKGKAITVDLSSDAFANTQVGSEVADRAVQQLVNTATAAAQQAGTPASTVKITVDGAAFDAWGAIRLGEAMQRAPMSAVQAQTWVTSPQEGEDLPAGTVTFKGFGTSFEANFVWEVRDESGAVVAKGFTMGGSGDGTFGELTFTAKLTPCRYTVEVAGDAPPGGATGSATGGAEGPGAAKDDKSFTVH
ncbi:MAG: Gmad2 immunoglobulin-like domain-containing protein [Dermatophilaceae bacterium]